MSEIINFQHIIDELKRDNDEVIKDLFNYYYPRLFSFSKSFLKIEEGIDDVIQEVFIKIWQNRKKITSSDSFNSFVFTITRNILLNELRSRLSNAKVREAIQGLSVSSEYHLIEQIQYQELKEQIDKVVDVLPDRQKEIFILSRENGLSHKEIAEKLGIGTKTVEYHISRSLSLLKENLTNHGLISLLYFFIFL